MKQDLLELGEFKSLLLEGRSVIDVRAPVEFADGSIPGSINLPILDNEQRAQIGTTFKKQGREAAITLGHALISGNVKISRLQSLSEYFSGHPRSVLTCFRGGLRSQITQTWLKEAGFSLPRIDGGYKAFRSFLLTEISRIPRAFPLLIVSGATGTGKTLALREISNFRSIVDLERLANHRGSAFGAFRSAQPVQVNFENELIADLLRTEVALKLTSSLPVLIEDESRLIGSRAIPEPIFVWMRGSSIVLIEESIEARVENTYREYVLNAEGPFDFQNFKSAVGRISRKLGGARAQEILLDLDGCERDYQANGSLIRNKVWIQKILTWYYDPMYSESIRARNPKILFRGTRQEVVEYLKNV